MLTGDNRATAESIGNTLGVDRILAEILPEDKAAEVRDNTAGNDAEIPSYRLRGDGR